MSDYEYCTVCSEPTGAGGIGDGSIYCAVCEMGPLCRRCAVLEDDAWCPSCAVGVIERLRAELEDLESKLKFHRRCSRGYVFISDKGEMETWVCADCHKERSDEAVVLGKAEYERLRAEVERVKGQRDAYRIRLQGYAGEVSRAIYPAISTIEMDIARRALEGEEVSDE